MVPARPAVLVGMLALCLASIDPTRRAWAQPPAASQPATRPATQPSSLPGIRVDRVARTVDLDATVILRDAKWIELLACKPKGPEHESILTIDARPSHIHLALLTLGVEPGAPLNVQWQPGQQDLRITPPYGPRVAVTILTQRDGKTVETPANEWVLNQKTGQPLTGNVWLFTGSKVSTFEGQSMYHADLNGTTLSLVSFGDDLLGRATEMTNQNDEQTWAANTPRIPPVGTRVVVRLRPLEDRAATQPATTVRSLEPVTTRPATQP